MGIIEQPAKSMKSQLTKDANEQLKNLDQLLNEKLPLNISDFSLLSTLSMIYDNDVIKNFKKMKNINQRLDMLK